MGRLIAGTFRWLGWRFLSFVAIVAILAVAQSLPKRLSDWTDEANRAAAAAHSMEAAGPNLQQTAGTAVSKANDEVTNIKAKSLQELNRLEQEIDQRRASANKDVLDGEGLFLAGATGDTGKITDSYRAQYVELPLLDRAAGLIRARRTNIGIAVTISSLREQIDKRTAAHNIRVAAYNAKLALRNKLQGEASKQWQNPLCHQVDVPKVCEKVSEIHKLDKELRKEYQWLQSDSKELKALRDALGSLKPVSEAISDASKLAGDAVARLKKDAETESQKAAGFVWNQALTALKQYGWWALWLLFGATVLPILHKVFAFYVIAPLTSRAAPLRLAPAGPSLTVGNSATAIDVEIDQDTELLVRTNAQDRPTSAQSGSVLVLDWRMLLTCLAAGLTNLQRFRSTRPDHVTVTGTEDEHGEVTQLLVPEGGAVVLQPRALIGVVKPRHRKLKIKRPWRVFWLMAWVTWQFRYIVFYGPCTLIVQGRCGVQVKEAGDGRATNQRLVIGFDAGLAYSAARAASLRHYIQGRSGLFDDRFDGHGRFIHEERPSGSAKGSIWGRGLKGVGDAVLSAFGI